MRLKNTKELRELSTFWRLDEKNMNTLIIYTGINNGFFENLPECYCMSMKDHAEANEQNLEFQFKSMFPLAHANSIDLFAGLITIGDGDCPECGGETIFKDGQRVRTGGDGYETPYEFETVWEQRECRHCGNIIHK